MGMSFITSLNMDGEMTGSQSLGSNGSWPLSITFLSSNHRLNDSRGGSIPEQSRRTSHEHQVIQVCFQTRSESYLLSGDTARGSVASVW